MGMKSRKLTEPGPPPEVADLGKTPEGWEVMHHYIHDFEELWDNFDPLAKSAFLNAMALFVGGKAAESAEPHCIQRLQMVVRCGYEDYDNQRNTICQAVSSAHTFETGDLDIN